MLRACCIRSRLCFAQEAQWCWVLVWGFCELFETTAEANDRAFTGIKETSARSGLLLLRPWFGVDFVALFVCCVNFSAAMLHWEKLGQVGLPVLRKCCGNTFLNHWHWGKKKSTPWTIFNFVNCLCTVTLKQFFVCRRSKYKTLWRNF